MEILRKRLKCFGGLFFSSSIVGARVCDSGIDMKYRQAADERTRTVRERERERTCDFGRYEEGRLNQCERNEAKLTE